MKADLLLVAVAVAIFSRLSYLAMPFDGDGAMFAYMGRLAADGGRFGEDLIDNKLPTVGLVTSVFWRAFGDWWPGYVLAQLGMTLLASVQLAREAAKTFGPYARLPVFLLTTTLMNLNAAVMAGFQLETLQTFFSCLSASFALAALRERDRRDAIGCGLAAGVAAMVKPTGAGVLGAFVIVAVAASLLSSKRRRMYGGLALGGILGLALPALCAILYLQQSQQLQLLPAIVTQIGEYASNSSFAVEDLFRPISLVTLFAAALLIRGWVYRRETYRVPERPTLEPCAFVALWLAMEFVGVLMQRRMYAYHFLPLAAPASVLFAAIPRRASLGQLAGVLALPTVISIWGACDVFRESGRRRDNAAVIARWLDQHTLPGDRVWRDMTPQILLPTDLQSGSRVQLTFLFMNSDQAPLRFSSMLLEDFRTRRPRYVVLPQSIDDYVQHQTTCVFELSRIPKRAANFTTAWRTIETFVRDNYHPVARIGQETIWARQEGAMP